MNNLIYKHEKPLFILAALLSLVFWAALIYFFKGALLAFMGVYFVIFLFVQSGFISHFRGRGVLISDAQLPDIQKRVQECAQKLNIKSLPEVYILQYNGVLNAFATRFMRTRYIVLMSDIIDALENDPDAINFYIGHELGHLRRRHLEWQMFLLPGLCLPLLGAAYHRAREYTCDLHGAACCSEDMAKKGLAVLAVGAKRYRTLDIAQYLKQTAMTSEFWMSFHELMASYPWLVKRVAAVSHSSVERMPKRNPFAYLPALFIPYLSITSLAFLYLVFVLTTIQGAINTIESRFDNVLPTMEGEMGAATDELTNRQIIDNIVGVISPFLPQDMGEGIVWKSVEIRDDNTLVYDYVLDPLPENHNSQTFAEDMKHEGFEAFCNSENLTDELINLYERGLKFPNRYLDKDGNVLAEVTFLVEECPNYKKN